jgi:quinol monooxygenase YgiN
MPPSSRPGTGLAETVGQRLLALVQPTRKEEGCIRYEIYQSTNNDNDWFIFETWKSTEAFDFHMQTPYVRGSCPGYRKPAPRTSISAFTAYATPTLPGNPRSPTAPGSK